MMENAAYLGKCLVTAHQNRRYVLKSLAGGVLLTQSAHALAHTSATGRVMTVTGLIDVQQMGTVLSHEHLFADIRPLSDRNPVPLDLDEVFRLLLPRLKEVQAVGYRTLVDCTAVGLGRNPPLLSRLSQASGVHILTNTGLYAANDGRFLLPYALAENEQALANRWIGEWKRGIADTGIRPGFIKLGFNGGPLPDIERKIIRAAAAAHLATGMPIGAHVGPWRDAAPGENGASALMQLDMLEQTGVLPTAYIWYHAQNEKSVQLHLDAARRGAWISYDGVAPDTIDQHVALIVGMKSAGRLDRLLVSHDAGWYNVGDPGGGRFRPFTTIFTALIPALKNKGFTEEEIRTIFVANPAAAYALR